jgi:membrane protease YdiL (CAAX protease family)
MLSELRRSYSLLGSGALIGLAWTAFHIPLWFAPELGYAGIPFPAFFISTMALSISMAYIVEISQGSLFIATLAHFLQNFCLGFLPALGVPADSTFYFYAGLNVAFAAALVFRYGWREALGRQPPGRQPRA